jgi:diguanylate cyclase (GGDEF)-like protein
MDEPDESRIPNLRAAIDEDDDDEGAPNAQTVHYRPSELLAGSRPEIPHVVVVRGANALGAIHRLRNGDIIGRALSADIQLAEPGVSRKHVKVTLLPANHVLFEDLDSSNGIFCDGERVQQRILKPGDEVQIGNARLSFLMMDALTPRRRQRRSDDLRLPTRSRIIGHLNDAIGYCRQYGSNAAIFVIAPDQIFDVFQRHGGAGVSDLLSRLAQVISDRIGDDETVVGRCGFGELSVVTPDADLVSAIRSAMWIQHAVAELEFELDDEPLRLSVSAGAAAFPEDGATTGEALLELASRRRHRARADGPNKVYPQPAPQPAGSTVHGA